MGDINHSLSLRLYQILDVIGASEDNRTLYLETAMNFEILNTIYEEGKTFTYQFGSACEGSTILDLNSDLDMLSCVEVAPVVEKIEVARDYGRSLLMVSDADTKPGYFKLQCVKGAVPQTIFQREIDSEEEDTDGHGRICIKNDFKFYPDYFEQNGPARTKRGYHWMKDTDYVTAFRCKTIPTITNFWLLKNYLFNWPSESQLDKMATYGCFFVGVNHPKSYNKEIEWRISFSLQERELMSSLNPTQHKCYILLKMIKKDIIQSRAGEKSISSYHCKTCLFRVLEISKSGFWTRRNLIHSVRVCLSVLLQWVKKRNCPNFFIPDENMFDKLDQETLDNVDKVLTDILKSGIGFLFSLQCDKIGTYLTGGSLTQIRKEREDLLEYIVLHNVFRTVNYHRKFYLKSAGTVCEVEKCLSKVINIYQYILTSDFIKDRPNCNVRMAKLSILPLIQTQIAQSIASLMVRKPRRTYSPELLGIFEYCINKSEDCDLLTSKLILATCYFRAGMLDKCKDLLIDCEDLLETFVTSICNCYSHRTYRNENLLTLLKTLKLSSKDFRLHCVTGCLLFLPSQANLVHPALRLEMYRSVYTPPESRDEHHDFWFDWILIDSRVYLYFLQYLLYSQTNNNDGKADAIESMLLLLDTDKNLGHQETACNLLGWIFSQENDPQTAIEFLKESWTMRPVHNAAKWQVCLMLATAFRSGLLG